MEEVGKQGAARVERRVSGVPLGGLGAGAVELGCDGWFRNITINNNRTSDTRIPIARASFLAVRIVSGARTYTRILQQALPEFPEEAAEAGPPRLPPNALSWRGLYPMAHYALADPASCADVVWSAFSPIIPFDHEASTLPAMFLSVRFANRSAEAQEVSALFNWENLCGHTRLQQPVRCAPVVAVRVDEHEEAVPLREKPRERDSGDEQGPEDDVAAASPNALEFGSTEKVSTNADGQYCLAVKRQPNARVSVLAWDHACYEDRRAFWTSFEAAGDLSGAACESDEKRSGAVCCTFSLPPRQERRVDFVLSWYCPRFEVKGVDEGNGYTNHFKDAREVVRHGLKNLTYYHSSVADWQRRVEASSLPTWLNVLLINSSSVFSTNSLFTKDGRFALFDSPAEPRTARLDTRLYTSLGLLLWFPRFENSIMTQCVDMKEVDAPDRLSRPIGPRNLHEPGFDAEAAMQQDYCAQVVLSAYHDYFSTGNLAWIQALFPRLRLAMAGVLARDRDGDGLPEPEGITVTYDGLAVRGLTSYGSSLWVAALRAYAKLAESQQKHGEARRYRALFRKAAASFEGLFWNEREGYYVLGRDPARSLAEEPRRHLGCHTGQLAGQWYADFLGFGSLFDPAHIARALDAIQRYNLRPYGLASAAMPDGSPCEKPDTEPVLGEAELSWSAPMMAHFACLQIYRGRAGAALRALEPCVSAIGRQPELAFNRPLKWDVRNNCVYASNRERHLSWLSAWYVLYALEGLVLNVPEGRLRVMPHLPEGMKSLSAPLFTPSCLGWLRFREDDTEGYRQRVQVSFDSPISIREIALRIPTGLKAVALHCQSPDGPVEVTHTLQPADHAQRLLVVPRHPIVGLRALGLTVTEGG